MGGDGGGLLISPEGVAPSRMVCLCYLPMHHKVQKKISSGTGCDAGSPGKKVVKQLCVCVCGIGASKSSYQLSELLLLYKHLFGCHAVARFTDNNKSVTLTSCDSGGTETDVTVKSTTDSVSSLSDNTV